MKKKKTKWIVVSKFVTRKDFEGVLKECGEDPDDFDIEDFNEVEISVAKKDNELGQKSYGWGGDNKIILFDGSDHEVTQKDMGWYRKVAKAVRDVLNDRQL